ncbi:MAG: hypothetical protein EOM20_01485 [Spartobacteria bacterium]|nr:hypothetical protein [Spartobacteria bacterium]
MRTRNIGWMWAAILLIGICSAQAQTVPGVINYQGKLMDGTNLFSGTVPIIFRLYDAPTGGMFPYCEDSNDVVVVDGLYSTRIGDDVTFGSLENALIQTQVWIEVVIGTNVITPREQLASVGYARYAAKLPANAVDMSMIAPNAIYSYHIADGQINSAKIGAFAISNVNLAANAVSTSVIADGNVTSVKILDGTITAADVATNTFWQTTGNANITPGTHFLGTTDDRPVEIYANNQRVLRLDNSWTMPNITIGQSNNYINPSAGSATISGGGGLGGGNPNRVTDNYGTIGGGAGNLAGNDAGSVFDAEYATIGGGANNRAQLSYATVAGGRTNVALSAGAAIGGGQMNRIADQSTNSVIAGGRANDIGTAAFDSSIGGGRANQIKDNASYSGIGAGQFNEIGELAENSVIGAGRMNVIESESMSAVIAGGMTNRITLLSASAVISGGRDNTISGGRSAIGGGWKHQITGQDATIAGGQQNFAEGDLAFVGGGYDNRAAMSAVVGGGEGNRAYDYASVVAGGTDNSALVNGAVVGGGTMNVASGQYATVSGGSQNRVEAPFGAVGGGLAAKADNYGEIAHAAGGFSAGAGSAQASQYVMRRQTTSSGSSESLYLDGQGIVMQVATNETVTFQALIVARADTGENASYRIEGMLEGQPAGGVVARGVTVTTIWEDDLTWDVGVSTSLSPTQDVFFEVQGNGENIRWVATVRTAEVGW